MFAVGSHDGRVRLVAMSGEERVNIAAHEGFVRGIALSPDGCVIASASNDCSWKLLDADRGEEILCVPGHTGKFPCICELDARGKCKEVDDSCPVDGHASEVIAIGFAPCGRRVVTGGVDHTVIVYDTRRREVERRLVGHKGPVFSVSISAGGGMLASGSRDRSLLVWDLGTGLCHRSFHDAHEMYVHSVAFAPDGRTIATTGGDTAVKLWDVEAGALLRSFAGHTHFVLTVAFSPDGASLASGGGSIDPSVRVWDVQAGTERLCLRGHDARDGCLCHAVMPNRGGIAHRGCPRQGHRDVVHAVEFSPDGDAIVSGGRDGDCKVWDAATGALRHTLKVDSRVWSVACGVNGVRTRRETRSIAFAMGLQERLGAASPMHALDAGVVRIVLEYVCGDRS